MNKFQASLEEVFFDNKENEELSIYQQSETIGNALLINKLIELINLLIFDEQISGEYIKNNYKHIIENGISLLDNIRNNLDQSSLLIANIYLSFSMGKDRLDSLRIKSKNQKNEYVDLINDSLQLLKTIFDFDNLKVPDKETLSSVRDFFRTLRLRIMSDTHQYIEYG
ncbi:MAG: hypothetical protein ACTSQ8_25370 [Candidatus Helarchaeota archaeon]